MQKHRIPRFPAPDLDAPGRMGTRASDYRQVTPHATDKPGASSRPDVVIPGQGKGKKVSAAAVLGAAGMRIVKPAGKR